MSTRQQKKILITGVSGLMGRALAHVLSKKNEVHGLARFNNPEVKKELQELRITLWKKDLTKDSLDDLPTDLDAIFHMAVHWGHPTDHRAQKEALAMNVYAVGNLLLHFKQVSQIVLGSTGSVYMPGNYMAKEDEAVHVPHPLIYCVTKICGESLADWVSLTFQIPCVKLRYFWPYTPYTRINPPATTIMQMMQGKTIEWNPKDPVPYTPAYISDIVNLTIKAASACSIPATAINIASNEVITCGDVIKVGERLLNKKAAFKEIDTPSSGYDIHTADVSKMEELLSPAGVNMEEGVRRVIRAEKEGANRPQDWMFE